MKPAPLPIDERARLAALRALALLDTGAEERFDRLARLARHIFGAPIALVSLVDDGRQWFKARLGLDVSETPRELAFCAHAILGDGAMVVPDAHADDRFHDNPLVTGDPHIAFYAGHPIRSPDGHKIGTLCVLDRAVHQPTTAQLAALSDLASLVEAELARETLARTTAQALATLDGFAAMLEQSPALVHVVGADGRLRYTNPTWRTRLGHDAAVGRPLIDVVAPESRDHCEAQLARLVAGESGLATTVEFVTRGGDRLSLTGAVYRTIDAHGEVAALGFFHDVTAQARALQLAEAAALTDPLTQLANRRQLEQRLQHEFALARRTQASLAIAVMDLDLFKLINDERGHGAGDAVLRAVADCLRGRLRTTDLAARLGGDEFVALLPGARAGHAERVLDEVRRQLGRQGVEHEGAQFAVTLSVGITELDDGDGDAAALLERADEALYEAKRAGRDCVVVRRNGS